MEFLFNGSNLSRLTLREDADFLGCPLKLAHPTARGFFVICFVLLYPFFGLLILVAAADSRSVPLRRRSPTLLRINCYNYFLVPEVQVWLPRRLVAFFSFRLLSPVSGRFL